MQFSQTGYLPKAVEIESLPIFCFAVKFTVECFERLFFLLEYKKVRKNNSYTAGFKLKIVECTEENGNRVAEKEWNVCEKIIRDRQKSKQSLQETYVNRQALRGPKHGISPMIENGLLNK